MDYINIILVLIAFATGLSTVVATAYGVSRKNYNTVLKDSNDAYEKRVEQLEGLLQQAIDEQTRKDIAHAKEADDLRGRIHILESIKTPPFEPLLKLIHSNHKELITILRGTK